MIDNPDIFRTALSEKIDQQSGHFRITPGKNDRQCGHFQRCPLFPKDDRQSGYFRIVQGKNIDIPDIL